MFRCSVLEAANRTLLSKTVETEDHLSTECSKTKEMEDDLRIEREWRQRLQEAAAGDKERIATMRNEMRNVQKVRNLTVY